MISSITGIGIKRNLIMTLVVNFKKMKLFYFNSEAHVIYEPISI